MNYSHYRVGEPPPPTPEELLASFPQDSDFDLTDLWQLTGSLCGEMPGIAVVGVYRSFSTPEGLSAYLSWNTWSDPQEYPNARIENVHISGEHEDLEALWLRTGKAMGSCEEPQYRYMLYDSSPASSPKPDEQKAVARVFLSRIISPGNTTLLTLNTLGKTRNIEQEFVHYPCASPNTHFYIVSQAVLNLRLASYVEKDVAPYHDIVERVQAWGKRRERQEPPHSWL